MPPYAGNREIENAAKFLIKNGGLMPKDLEARFRQLPDTPSKAMLTLPAQKLLALRMYEKYMSNRKALKHLEGA